MTRAPGLEVELSASFADAMALTRDALKAEGFGILTEIDLKAAFQEKLGKAFRPFTILGACNPPLAYAAVSADPAVALLLPCNVTVEERDAGRTLVRLVSPLTMLGAVEGGLHGEVERVARDASARLERVHAALRKTGDNA